MLNESPVRKSLSRNAESRNHSPGPPESHAPHTEPQNLVRSVAPAASILPGASLTPHRSRLAPTGDAPRPALSSRHRVQEPVAHPRTTPAPHAKRTLHKPCRSSVHPKSEPCPARPSSATSPELAACPTQAFRARQAAPRSSRPAPNPRQLSSSHH